MYFFLFLFFITTINAACVTDNNGNCMRRGQPYQMYMKQGTGAWRPVSWGKNGFFDHEKLFTETKTTPQTCTTFCDTSNSMCLFSNGTIINEYDWLYGVTSSNTILEFPVPHCLRSMDKWYANGDYIKHSGNNYQYRLGKDESGYNQYRLYYFEYVVGLRKNEVFIKDTSDLGRVYFTPTSLICVGIGAVGGCL
jgi:hypothetical protein